MDPVFTLQWPEFILANRLQKKLTKKNGYSVLIPLSRQEKGIDLAVLKKEKVRKTHVVTLQIKASRTYRPDPPKRKETKRFSYHTWFNRFNVPKEVDFFLLVGIYAPDSGRTKRVTKRWYRDCTLLFNNGEMRAFIKNCLTVKGKPDKMFGFGFDNPSQVFQVRGDKHRESRDFSDHLLDKRIGEIKKLLSS
ncbi:MAG: hypothetical protein HYR80_04505 [Nitrospirae bacterium]|nr:hypothetical protein [Nitrospirota bacterium]